MPHRIADYLSNNVLISSTISFFTSLLTFVITDMESVNFIVRTVTGMVGLLIAVLTAIPLIIKRTKEFKSWWKGGTL